MAHGLGSTRPGSEHYLQEPRHSLVYSHSPRRFPSRGGFLVCGGSVFLVLYVSPFLGMNSGLPCSLSV